VADPRLDLQGHRLAAEALETTRIHGVASRTGARTSLVTTRPCRAPPHPIADVGWIGGGQVPRPGEGSLAHHPLYSAWPVWVHHIVLRVPRIVRQRIHGAYLQGTVLHSRRSGGQRDQGA
jgi:hypothetical protein